MERQPEVGETDCAAVQMLVNPVGFRAGTSYECYGCSALTTLSLLPQDVLKVRVAVNPLDNCAHIDKVISQD